MSVGFSVCLFRDSNPRTTQLENPYKFKLDAILSCFPKFDGAGKEEGRGVLQQLVHDLHCQKTTHRQ